MITLGGFAASLGHHSYEDLISGDFSLFQLLVSFDNLFARF